MAKDKAPGGPSLGWSVGRFEWLDKEESKVRRYWRAIEYGSAETGWPWVNKRIVGLWGPNAGPRGGLHHGDLSMFSDRRDQKFVPFFKSIEDNDAKLQRAGRSALTYFFGGGPSKGNLHFQNEEFIKANVNLKDKRGNRRTKDPARARANFYFWLMTRARIDEMPFVTSFVMEEIPVGNFYAKTLRSFNPLEREVQALKEELGFQNLRTTRQYQAEDSYDKAGREIPAKKGTPNQDKSYETRMGNRFLVSVSASGRTQDNIRNAFGRFTSGQAITAAVNRRMSIEFQAALVERMQRSRERPSTGDLIAAHGNAQNRLPH